MKKTILSMLLAAAVVSPAFAQSQQPSRDGNVKKEARAKARNQNLQCCATLEECNAANAGCAARQGQCCVALNGIELTDAQKAKISQINSDRLAKRAEARKAADKARRDKRMRSDSTAKAEKREYLKNMKEVLTPEQYVVFLENMVVERSAPQARHIHGKNIKGKGMKGKGINGCQMKGKGQRPDRLNNDGKPLTDKK